MMVNNGASKTRKKTASGVGDDEECSATKKDITSRGGDDDDGGVCDDDDDSSDGFLVIDEKNDVVFQHNEDDDGSSDADVESYSSWNEVDMIESTPPSPPNTTMTTTTTTTSREQQIRSSLNYDGYLEVDDDGKDKVDKIGKVAAITNENTGNCIEKTPPTVIFDSTLNKEGYMEVCQLQEEEEVLATNKEVSDPVVLEGVLMLGKNARGRILVRILLLTVIFPLMLALCHESGNNSSSSDDGGGNAIPPQGAFLAWNATSSNSSSSHIHTTSSPWLAMMPLPTTVSPQAHDDKRNAMVWINDRICTEEHWNASSSSSYINGSIILAPRPIKIKNKKDSQSLYPYWISQQRQQEATTLDVYLFQLLEKKRSIPHVASFQQLMFIDIVDRNHNDNDDKAFYKNNNISAWRRRRHDSAVGAVGFPAKTSDLQGNEPALYTVELFKANTSQAMGTLKEKASLAVAETNKSSLLKRLYHALFEMDVASGFRRRRHHHALNTSIASFPMMNHHYHHRRSPYLKPLYTVQVEHAPAEEQWIFFERKDLNRAMNWRRYHHDRSQWQLTSSHLSSTTGRVLFSAQPGISSTSGTSGAVGFPNKIFFMGHSTCHQFEDMSNTTAQGLTRWDFDIARDVFWVHHCQYPISTDKVFSAQSKYPRCDVNWTVTQGLTRLDFNITQDVFWTHHVQYPYSSRQSTSHGVLARSSSDVGFPIKPLLLVQSASSAPAGTHTDAARAWTDRAKWKHRPHFLASSSRRSVGRCHHGLGHRRLHRRRCEQQHTLNTATSSLVAVRSSSVVGFPNGLLVKFPPDSVMSSDYITSVGFPNNPLHDRLTQVEDKHAYNTFRPRILELYTLNTSTAPGIKRNTTTLVTTLQALPGSRKQDTSFIYQQVKTMLRGNQTRAFSIPQSKISWIHKSTKDNLTVRVPRLQYPASIHTLGKVTPVGALIVYKKASFPLILRNMNSTILMPRLRMNISASRQMNKHNTVGSALIVRAERVANDVKRNVTGAFDLAKLQTHVNRNKSNNYNHYKTTGALIALEQPMSPVAILTSAAAQIQLQQLPVTVVVSSEKNQTQVADQETGQLVIFNNPHWKTPEPGSVRVLLAARSMFLALILMNKKDLSLFNYPFKTTTTAVSVWSAVNFNQYGMNRDYCWTKVQEHFYSLMLQLDQEDHSQVLHDDSVAVRIAADEKKSNVPYHLAHAMLSASHHNMMSSSEW